MNRTKISGPIAIMSLLLIGSVFILSAPATKAAGSSAESYTPLAPLPCIAGNGITCSGGNGAVQNTVNFETYVQNMINLLIALSAVAAVVMIVWGGIEYMTTSSISGKGAGLDKVRHAIYGLLLVLCSFLILQTIDPRLTAIPTTLVPKITLSANLTADATGLLFSDAATDANTTHLTNAAGAGADIKLAQDQLANDTQVLGNATSSLQSCTDGTMAPDSEFCTELNKNIALAQQKINQDKVDIANGIAKAAFNGVYGTAASVAMNSDQMKPADVIKACDQAATDLLKSFDQNAKKIDALGGDRSILNQSFNYSEGALELLDLNAKIADGNHDSAHNQSTIDDAQSRLNSITDPSLSSYKTDLQAKLDAAQILVNKYKSK